MLKKIQVGLRPIVSQINLPTVIKTAILPNDTIERLFIATQVGEIFYIGNNTIETFLDIKDQILTLGTANGGYDERGLLGLAFHPDFTQNGLFYLHYSVAGSLGTKALQGFNPDSCNPESFNLKWINRESQYDHIDTVEEWIYQPAIKPQKRRTLLNLRRPFFNHNGVNSLNFSPESGKLILTTGDGGSGYDPFNLSQDDFEIAGKIIEIDVDKNPFIYDPPIVSRFSELPISIQQTLTVIAKGVRNISGISFQKINNRYYKYIGNVGQDLVEAIYGFERYKTFPVVKLHDYQLYNEQQDFINFGWRGWEGAFPTSIVKQCSSDSSFDEKAIVYYDEAITTLFKRLPPLTSYFHNDPRPEYISGAAITGVQCYMGNSIPDLKGKVVFSDFAWKKDITPLRGALGYTNNLANCILNDYGIIEINYQFRFPSFYVSLGTNINQDRLFLGVYSSMSVTNPSKGTVYEIIPNDRMVQIY